MRCINKKRIFFFFFLQLSLISIIFQNYAFSYSYILSFEPKSLHTAQQNTLIIGVRSDLFIIDPHDAYDPHSFNYIEQVCEGLYTCDYSDPSNRIIPRLALDYPAWDPDENRLVCGIPIEHGITFHDGTPFNATAVQWNFDRLACFINSTGDLPSYMTRAQIWPEYFWPDGTPIINSTHAYTPNHLTIVLNRPYGALEGLLSFVGSYILSPTSTNFTEYITLPDGKLVGTGPFKCGDWSSSTEITMEKFDNYWRLPWLPDSEIDTLIYKIYNDEFDRCQALLDGEIDFLINPHESFIDSLNNSQDISLIETEKGSWVTYFIAMNNILIDRKIREAISYAVDYDFIIENLRNGLANKLKSPIPDGLLYSNYSLNVPSLNITYAREVMQSEGYGVGFTTDEEWETANFFSLNITYYNNSKYRPIYSLLKNNLARIGIDIEDAGEDYWVDYYIKLTENRNQLEIFALGWSAFWNDPCQFINVLYGNESAETNYFQYNGGFGDIVPYDEEEDVQILMRNALNETASNNRKRIYDKIQELMVERDFPLIWLYTPKIYIAYDNDLEGIQENTFCLINQNDDSSLKGDVIAVKWADTGTDGATTIPGYPPIIFGVILLLFTYYIIKKEEKMEIKP
ncbi:MAG: ABC transporter substrate-binding protein [Promethearchaeota archaeon]